VHPLLNYLWRAIGIVSVMKPGTELQEVSPLWSQLWKAIESASLIELAMDSYRNCLRYEACHGEL